MAAVHHPFNAGAVVALGEDAGDVDGEGVEQHQPDRNRRHKKSEYPKGQNRQPIGSFARRDEAEQGRARHAGSSRLTEKRFR